MVTTKVATMPMIVMTISISISVKASRERSCLLLLVFMVGLLSIGRTRSNLLFPHLLLHALAQPLFDHALVIEIARTGQALDARQHPRVDAQRDRDRIGQFASGRDRGLH